jgi:hypothetical protein
MSTWYKAKPVKLMVNGTQSVPAPTTVLAHRDIPLRIVDKLGLSGRGVTSLNTLFGELVSKKRSPSISNRDEEEIMLRTPPQLRIELLLCNWFKRLEECCILEDPKV